MEPAERDEGLGVRNRSRGRTSEGSRRFRLLDPLDEEEKEGLSVREKAGLLADQILEDTGQRVERKLIVEGFLPKQAEMPIDEFQETHDKLQSIEEEWEAALERKDYSEVDTGDLESLQSLVEQIRDATELERKASRYTELVHEHLDEVEISQEDLKEIHSFEPEEEEEDNRVGKHLSKVSKPDMEGGLKAEKERIRSEREQIKSIVEERIEEERKELAQHLSQYEEQKLLYENYLEILQAMEKELEAIEENAEEDEVNEMLGGIKDELDVCIENTRDIIDHKEEVVKRMKTAEGMKETVSKVFYRGFLN
ncbi:MAG: hypothetical protein ABEI58_03270 [Candidatus Nanohaloarchaea archaeon]